MSSQSTGGGHSLCHQEIQSGVQRLFQPLSLSHVAELCAIKLSLQTTCWLFNNLCSKGLVSNTVVTGSQFGALSSEQAALVCRFSIKAESKSPYSWEECFHFPGGLGNRPTAGTEQPLDSWSRWPVLRVRKLTYIFLWHIYPWGNEWIQLLNLSGTKICSKKAAENPHKSRPVSPQLLKLLE